MEDRTGSILAPHLYQPLNYDLETNQPRLAETVESQGSTVATVVAIALWVWNDTLSAGIGNKDLFLNIVNSAG